MSVFVKEIAMSFSLPGSLGIGLPAAVASMREVRDFKSSIA
jgi:hypothetical protein